MGKDKKTARRGSYNSGINRKSSMNIFSFEFKEITDFEYTPELSGDFKYELKSEKYKGKYSLQSSELFLKSDGRKLGLFVPSRNKTKYIKDKYIYVFERSVNGGVRLNCELRGLTKEKQLLKKYNSKREEVERCEQLSLATEDINSYNIEYFFLLSGFRLSNDRIKVIVEQLKKNRNGHGMTRGGIHRFVGFNVNGFTNYSSFNHTIYSEEKSSDGTKIRKFTIYLTDTVDLLNKIYNNFLHAYTRHLEWSMQTKDEEAQKLIYISNGVDSLYKSKDGHITGHKCIKGYDIEALKSKIIEFNDSFNDSFKNKIVKKLAIDITKKREIENPEEFFTSEKPSNYVKWKKKYDSYTAYYTGSTLYYGMALVKIISTKEFRHQIQDLIFGSYEPNSANQFSLEDIYECKYYKKVFNDEEGESIFTNILGPVFSSLVDFPGTTTYIRKYMMKMNEELHFINSYNFDLKKMSLSEKSLDTEILLLYLLAGRKLTAGLASLIEQLAFNSIIVLRDRLRKIQNNRIDLVNYFKELDEIELNLKEKFKNRFGDVLTENSDLKKRIMSRRKQLNNEMNEYKKYFNNKRITKKRLRQKAKQLVISNENSNLITNLEDKLKNGFTVDTDANLLDADGNFVSIPGTWSKSGKKVKLKAKRYIAVDLTLNKLNDNDIHTSIKEAQKKEIEEFKKLKEDLKKVEQFKNEDNNIQKAKEEVTSQRQKLNAERNDILNSHQKKKNKLDVADNFSIIAALFETINLAFTIKDFIASKDDDRSIDDYVNLIGSSLDFSASFFEAVSIYLKKFSRATGKVRRINSVFFLRFSNVLGKIASIVGLFSGIVDTYVDISDSVNELKEGDIWGLRGELCATMGSMMVVIGTTVGLLGGPASGVLVAIGLFMQLYGNTYAKLFGSDHYEMWLRHSCWGIDFGEHEYKLLAYFNNKPNWAIKYFTEWDDIKDENSSQVLKWAGDMDCQIKSYCNLVYGFVAHFSAASRIYAPSMREYNEGSKRFELSKESYINTGYVELNLTIPYFSSSQSVYNISIWLEDEMGGTKNHILKEKKMCCFGKTRLDEIIKNNADNELSEILSNYRDDKKYIFGNRKLFGSRKYISLQLLDSEVNDDEKINFAGNVNYRRFFDYDDNVIRIKSLGANLRSIGEPWARLCVSVNFDYSNNGIMIVPQNETGGYDVVLTIPLSQIIENTSVSMSYNVTYLGANPAAYYYDLGGKQQYPGTITNAF